MASVNITFNGRPCPANTADTILSAAAANGIYIPTLCHHPDLPPFCDLPAAPRVFRGDQAWSHQATDADELRRLQGCGLCVVTVAGQSEPVRACQTAVSAGLSIETNGAAVQELRRVNLMRIMARHPHACLTCAQREGCSLESCSSNVPREERCCSKFHHCELRTVAEYVGIKEETPRFRHAGIPALRDEPLFSRDFNLCIDCARCVRVCNQVRGVEALGLVQHDGRLIVGSIAAALLGSACKFCGACVEVCPTGCLLDKDLPAGDRAPALVPCVHTCPAGVDVPGYIRRIAAGDFQGAAAVVWETLPLPNTLGHICFHLCEYECRRGRLDEPLAICALKRFALENGDGSGFTEVVKIADSGKKIAVVGGGPAGLTAAFFLRLRGHRVTVFEAGASAGGMPVLSVPDYRLPPAVLEKDLGVIRKLGVEIRTGIRVPDGAAMTALRRDGYDAVLVAVGLAESKKLPIVGADLPGVFWGLEFLRAAKAGQRVDLGREIVVVGGGNVAIDVAMTARRVANGAVRLFCLESRAEMPSHAQEIQKAEAEGIEINTGWGPVAIQGSAGKTSGVEFRRCTAVFDVQHKFAPVFDEQQRMTVAADAVLLAIGQAAPKDLPGEGSGIFLAGDIAGGQMSVVHAVASGRSAAERIDQYLGGTGEMSVRLHERVRPSARIGREDGFAPRPRVPFPCAPAAQRCADFREIEGTYSREAAVAEARRCLRCDLRLELVPPALPPEKWLEFSQANVEQVPAVEGVVVLADVKRKPTAIKGVANIQEHLRVKLAAHGAACYFLWEPERLYTKRESELIQQHVQQYGQLPGGGMDELDELF